jgi:hypothetical protein
MRIRVFKTIGWRYASPFDPMDSLPGDCQATSPAAHAQRMSGINM